jgi:hypothetical protein
MSEKRKRQRATAIVVTTANRVEPQFPQLQTTAVNCTQLAAQTFRRRQQGGGGGAAQVHVVLAFQALEHHLHCLHCGKSHDFYGTRQ